MLTVVHLSNSVKALATYFEPYAIGSDLYRVIYEIYSDSKGVLGGLIKFYEIWLSREFVEDKKRLSREASKEEILQFANNYLSNRYKENDNSVPPEDGYFLTNATGEVPGNPQTFPLTGKPRFQKTTMLLQEGTHKWLRKHAIDNNTSLGDLLQRLIMQYVETQKRKQEAKE